MKKHSTGALTKEMHKQQDILYNKKSKYDVVIIGTGMAALTVGSLLAHAGKKVCMLEAHDVPGGYAHTFKMGDFQFCAQIHYIWGCSPGERIYEFLKHIGLEKDITFELFDSQGYDRIVLPDGKKVMIPYGFDKLEQHIEAAYPGQGKNVRKFCTILSAIRKEITSLPKQNSSWWEYAKNLPKCLTLLKHRKHTLQDVFDACNLSKEAQAVLAGNAGNFMLPPERLSIFAYCALFSGYNVGAYYPTKHFKYLTERLASFITQHEGCHIFYETEVTKINTTSQNAKENIVTSIETKDGKTFTAAQFICNMDPQAASYMIGRDKFPASYIKKLDYEYSPSGIMIYLGLKDIDLVKHGFGKYNTWHLTQWDMNKTWKEELEAHAFDNPWFFISTPTLHTKKTGTAPKGCHVMEIATVTGYDVFKNMQKKSYKEYNQAKMALADKMLDLVETYYVPDLRKHIAVKVIGTPVTHEDFCVAIRGNAYGSNMTPEQMGLGRLKAKTSFQNFFWCNASSGYAGIYGTVATGMNLYMDITEDKFFDSKKIPSDEEILARIKKHNE